MSKAQPKKFLEGTFVCQLQTKLLKMDSMYKIIVMIIKMKMINKIKKKE